MRKIFLNILIEEEIYLAELRFNQTRDFSAPSQAIPSTASYLITSPNCQKYLLGWISPRLGASVVLVVKNPPAGT